MSGVEEARIDKVTEQLYALLPSELRSADAGGGYALKALVKVLAGGSAEVDAAIERLYDGQFVETAAEDQLSAFAQLVAAELLQPLPPGAQQNPRAYIANTIRYRRGKGTARVLESLATDVGGFATMAVEYFERLARLQHLLDVRPERPGTALLVDGASAERVGTARDRMARLHDVRSIARAGGRHAVPHVGVHILRPQAPAFPAPPRAPTYPAAVLAGVPMARPWAKGAVRPAGFFQLAARNGDPVRLFNPDRRSQDDGGRAVETALADRLRRLPLHRETAELREALAEGRPPRLPDEPWFDELDRPFAIFVRRRGETDFQRIPPAAVRIANLEKLVPDAAKRPPPTLTHTWGWDPAATPPARRIAAMPIACSFDPLTGRLVMAKDPSLPEAEEVRIAHATGICRPIGAGAQDRQAPEVPNDITDTAGIAHLVWVVDATIAAANGSAASSFRRVRSLAEALAEWDAGGKGKRGVIVLVRCDCETAAEIAIPLWPGSELQVVSGQWSPALPEPGVPVVSGRRGFITRAARRYTIDAPVEVVRAAAAGADAPGSLLLDGIEMTRGIEIRGQSVSRLHLRHATLRNPGGDALRSDATLKECTLVAERSILGRIAPKAGSTAGSSRIELRDSVVSADGASGAALAAEGWVGALANVTVFGETRLRTAEATNVIFTGPITVERHQEGCLRYCHVPEESKPPRRFRCQPGLALGAARAAKGDALGNDEREAVILRSRPRFLDIDLSEPTVAMLHPRCSLAIRRGGEGEAEIGAFALAAEALREANVTQFFDDYLPFGLEAGLIDDTRSSAIAARRNRP